MRDVAGGWKQGEEHMRVQESEPAPLESMFSTFEERIKFLVKFGPSFELVPRE